MSRPLTAKIEQILQSQSIDVKFKLLIEDVNISNYLISWSIDFSKEFGSAQATFVLNNNDGRFNETEQSAIYIGDKVSFKEYFQGDSTEFPKFYGFVNQRNISKTATDRTFTIVCLDFISSLQFLDIDLEVEGTRVLIENEVLTPNFLSEPNETLAQIFNFANDSLADNPIPIFMIRSKYDGVEDPAYDGFEVLYDVGQLKLGYPLNAKDNYDLIAIKYYYYITGVYLEDVLEEILVQPDGYGKYLFDESSAQDVIDNHLTSTFLQEKVELPDYMTPNYTNSTITLKTTLTSDVTEGATEIYVDDISLFPESGVASINGDIFLWTSKESNNALAGIPSSGSYALKAHSSGSYVKYEAVYLPGRVWYLSFSNILTELTSSDFTLPEEVNLKYFDKRFGRIILDTAISTSSTVTCNSNYSFKTMQATGIELNKISFRSREVENRLGAVQKLREYAPPNWIIRTQGDERIWASFLSQKVNEDYTLQLTTQTNYLEDEDLYSRVILYGKNKNPTNLMLSGDVDFVGTGETYKGTASAVELLCDKEEGNFYIYRSQANIGEIIVQNIKPIVYVNEVPIDNTSHIIAGQQVALEITTRTETTVSGGKSLPKGTLIELENNNFKLIEELEPGEEIKGGKILQIVHYKYTKEQKLYEFIFSNNRKVLASYSHPFDEKILEVKELDLTITEAYDIYTESGYYFINGVKTLSTLSKNYNSRGIYYNKNKLKQKIGRFFNKIFSCNKDICKNNLLGCQCGGGGDTKVTSHTYYYYRIKFPHNSIDPSKAIIFYDAYATDSYIIPAYYQFMDYGKGVLSIPGTRRRYDVERVATATYWVFYSTDDLIIDYENALFKISKKIIKSPASTVVKATFEYLATITPFRDIASVIDGRWDTQVQTRFFSEPVTGYNYAILDLGSIKQIQALDIVAGFFKPDEYRKFDIGFTLSLMYSLNGTDYYDISDKTRNVEFTGGQGRSFEEEDLGIGFQARYIKVILDKVKKIEFSAIYVTVSENNRKFLIDSGLISKETKNGTPIVWRSGTWVVAFANINAYDIIIIKAESKLIPTTVLTEDINIEEKESGEYPTTINVESTEGFEEPGSNETLEAYILNSDGTSDTFYYTGLTSTSFIGVSGLSESHSINDYVVKEIEGDSTLYDYYNLLPKLGDRLYKENKVDEDLLYSESQLKYVSKLYLKEFIKNHSKISTDVVYSPHLNVGDTIRLIDPFNNIDTNYFIESIRDNSGFLGLVLARYPSS